MRGLLKNKGGKFEGIHGLTMFFVVLGGVLILGLILALGGTVVKEVSDNIRGPIENTGNSLSSGAGTKGLAIWDSMMSFLPWLLGGVYFLTLLGVIGLSYAYRISGQKFLIILFFGLSIMVIFGSILISNTYQHFYEQGNSLALELQSFTLLSWLLLYSPVVITLICFVGGAIMFSGLEEVGSI